MPTIASAPTEVSYSATNTIQWTFDSTILPVDQSYILDLWTQIEPAINTVVGPPSANLTVTISFGSTGSYAALYLSNTNTMKLGRLPQQPGYTGLERIDPKAFNQAFTHECVHTYQDASLDLGGWPAWVPEGLAVAATGIVSELVPTIDPTDSVWGLPYLSSVVDELSQGGPNVAGGTQYFAPGIFLIDQYFNAGGLFWILTASQSKVTAANWSEFSYLRDFSAQHYTKGRSFSAPDVLQTIEETALQPVDGRPAKDWTLAQPVTNINGDEGIYMWANVVQPFTAQNPLSGGTLFFQPAQRFFPGGDLSPIYSGTIDIRARDITGSIVHSETFNLHTGGFGWQFIFVPPEASTAGAYLWEFDASAIGGGITYRVWPEAGPGAADYNGSSGYPLSFFDPATERLAEPSISVTGATSSAETQGAFWAVPSSTTTSPAKMTVHAGALNAEVTQVGPYRRLVRLDLPPGCDAGCDAGTENDAGEDSGNDAGVDAGGAAGGGSGGTTSTGGAGAGGSGTGEADSGSHTDAGAIDASTDASPSRAREGDDSSGCGCHETGFNGTRVWNASIFAIGAVVFACVRRRRRRVDEFTAQPRRRNWGRCSCRRSG